MNWKKYSWGRITFAFWPDEFNTLAPELWLWCKRFLVSLARSGWSLRAFFLRGHEVVETGEAPLMKGQRNCVDYSCMRESKSIRFYCMRVVRDLMEIAFRNRGYYVLHVPHSPLNATISSISTTVCHLYKLLREKERMAAGKQQVQTTHVNRSAANLLVTTCTWILWSAVNRLAISKGQPIACIFTYLGHDGLKASHHTFFFLFFGGKGILVQRFKKKYFPQSKLLTKKKVCRL